MKKLMTLALAAGMLLGAATGAGAIDFKAKGQWLMGFSAGDGSLISHTKAKGSDHNSARDTDDIFSASQRVRTTITTTLVRIVRITRTTWTCSP